MKPNPYPLLFKPVYKEYIWGGNRISRLPGRAKGPEIRAESWEISDRPEGMSVVSNGPLKGKSLKAIQKKMGKTLTGSKWRKAGFPLLMKIIDSADNLSIQVHPDDKTAKLLKADPKTEAWHILDAKPGACIYSLKPGAAKQALLSALKDGTAGKLMKRIPVRKGQTYFIPAGTVHAIGKGCLILEVQQNSDTTYRLFDWNRKGNDGKPRQLHIADAIKSINWKGCAPVRSRPGLISRNKAASLYCVSLCRYFVIERLVLKGMTLISQKDTGSFTAIFNPSNDVGIICEGKAGLTIRKGATCLIPAGISSYKVKPLAGKAELILVRLP